MKKVERLSALDDVEIFEIEVNSIRGFLVRGVREGIAAARIQMIDTQHELDIRLSIYGPKATDDSMILGILRSLEVNRHPAQVPGSP